DAGTEVAPAVVLVPARCGEPGEIDVFPFHDVLQDRPGLHHLGLEPRGRRLPLPRLAAQGMHQRRGVEMFVKAQRHRHPPRVAHRTGEHAVAGRVADDVVEEQRGRGLPAVVDLGDGADLEVPMRARDMLQLAQALDARNPRAQVGWSLAHGWMMWRYLAAISGGVASTSLRIW